MQEDFAGYADEIARGLADDSRPRLSTISAAELQAKDLPPLRFVVEGLIPQGQTLIASPPKYGKSWMMLDLGIAVATGDLFLGFRTQKSTVLYLALEDSERRLRERMGRLLNGAPAPEGFYLATAAGTTDNGLLDELEGFVREHPDTDLVIIDTLQKVRGRCRDNSYQADYREMATLKRFADEHNLALVLIHHTRKMDDSSDVFARISGTTAITGATDTSIVLSRENRNSDTTVLSATGRDIESMELELRFDTASCRWQNLGDTEALAEQRARDEYDNDPIVLTIKKLLSQAPSWSGTASELMEAGKYIVRRPLATSAKTLSAEITALEKPLFDYDMIIHTRAKNGSGGGRHSFMYSNSFVEINEQETIPFE